MRETKLEVKKWGPSEKISLTSEISLASEISLFRLTCENLDMPNSEMVLNFFEISLGFSLKLSISLGTVPSENFHFRFSQNFR